MKKLRIYLETSVVGCLLDEYSQERKLITEKFFQEIKEGRFEVFISDLVLKELEATKDLRRRKQLKEKVANFKVFKVTGECRELALEYLKEKVIPRRALNDAIHLAAATVYNLDLIVSWNLKHIVKVKTRIEANAINLRNNYKTIEIATPEEVIENE